MFRNFSLLLNQRGGRHEGSAKTKSPPPSPLGPPPNLPTTPLVYKQPTIHNVQSNSIPIQVVHSQDLLRNGNSILSVSNIVWNPKKFLLSVSTSLNKIETTSTRPANKVVFKLSSLYISMAKCHMESSSIGCFKDAMKINMVYISVGI